MGQWGVKSYENDYADEALDTGFEEVHPDRYEELMDDRNPLTYEQAQSKIADPETLEASIRWICATAEPAEQPWDDETRLALAGVVVRYAELGIKSPAEWHARAIEWLEGEEIEWEEATLRELRRKKEIAILRKLEA